MILQVMTIPQQNNYHDCGLFTLTYMDYFCFHPPKQIHFSRMVSDGPLYMCFGDRLRDDDFLKKSWFKKDNPSNLRLSLMVELLEGFESLAQQSGDGDALRYVKELKIHYQQQFLDQDGAPTSYKYAAVA